jgi:hypothetical protein
MAPLLGTVQTRELVTRGIVIDARWVLEMLLFSGVIQTDPEDHTAPNPVSNSSLLLRDSGRTLELITYPNFGRGQE